MQGFLEVGLLALLPTYLKSVGYDDAAAGALMAGVLLTVLACQAPVGWLADRLGRRQMLVGCFAATAAALLVVPAAGVGLVPCLLVAGVASGAFYPLGLALMGEKVTTADVPRANAWFLGVNSFGSLVGPAAAGAVMEALGPAALFPTSAAVVVAALAAAVWVGRPGTARPATGQPDARPAG